MNEQEQKLKQKLYNHIEKLERLQVGANNEIKRLVNENHELHSDIKMRPFEIQPTQFENWDSVPTQVSRDEFKQFIFDEWFNCLVELQEKETQEKQQIRPIGCCNEELIFYGFNNFNQLIEFQLGDILCLEINGH